MERETCRCDTGLSFTLFESSVSAQEEKITRVEADRGSKVQDSMISEV